MDAITRNGFGTSGGSEATNFQADLIWEKPRNIAQNHYLVDSVRGITSGTAPFLSSNSTSQEQNANWYNAPTSTSISFNSNDWGTSTTLVDWIWRAGGTPAVTNTNGSITSTISVNTTSGFSIVTYTGTGTNRPSIGHGLGVAPSMIIEKGRDAGTGPYSWTVQHISLSSWNNSLFLNNTSAENSGSGGGTAPTSTVYYSAPLNYSGESGVKYVSYCFAPIAGFSAFGSYVGNDSNDGTFIYTGFRPVFVLYKKANGTDGWAIYDAKRNSYNVADAILQPDTNGAEAISAPGSIDIVSNGFKQRNSNNFGNSSSFTYIYAAFAEYPFKYANAR
jgi:hypothetical protein